MLTLKLLTLETVTAAWGVLSRGEVQEHAPGAESRLGPRGPVSVSTRQEARWILRSLDIVSYHLSI